MNNRDPVQMLIDAGAIPSNPFDEDSRYRKVAIALLPPARAGKGQIPYLRRRFIAQPADITIAAWVSVNASERPDLLATRTLGQPLAWWRLADANGVDDPDQLTAQVGARVAIPVITG